MNDFINRLGIPVIIIEFVIFALLFLLFFILARFLFRRLRKYVNRTPGQLDNFILDLFRVPAIWMMFWIFFKIFSAISLNELTISVYIAHITNILLILSISWVLMKFVQAGSYYLQNKLDITSIDNLHARRSLTQIKVFQRIANTIIVIVAISISLLTYDKAKTIGLSLLTSAGVFGIIIGLAAQKSIGMILAGIQIAITQPIRIDDVVIVEGEWGRIEEITLTYVVVKIWDERRLILPVDYFLSKPFQNWTRTSADIIGTIFIFVDYTFPVESIRLALPEMLKGNTDWDGRVMNVQVTNTTDRYKEVRMLLSSSDASKNWNLRTAIREKLIDYINANHPDTFAKIRVKNDMTNQVN
jgi:small-conductance mechanosensitive channel